MSDDAALWVDLEKRAEALAVPLTGGQIDDLKKFCAGVQLYSSHTNIVGNSELQTLVYDHVLDSLALVPLLLKSQKPPSSLVDIGSGGGFPAVILAIALPDLQTTLVESNGKKARFLREISEQLALGKRTTICLSRAEELAHDKHYRENYDGATARAVATFSMCAELVLPFLKVYGVFLAQKTKAQQAQELETADLSLARLGGRLAAVHELEASVLGKEKIVIEAQKIAPTPPPYPRSWNKIKSAPIGL